MLSQRGQNYKKFDNQRRRAGIIMLFYNKVRPTLPTTRLVFTNKNNLLNISRLPIKSCGGRTRTCDLQVMSLASYQLLHSAIFTV